MTTEPKRWLPAQNSSGRWWPIMVVPHEVDDEGNVKRFKVWCDGPERDGHGQVWDAETLRRYYKPEDGA